MKSPEGIGNQQSKYPGTFTDAAQVGQYTFDVSNLFNQNTECAFEPVVKRNGEAVDDYSLDNQITQGFNSRSGDRTKTYPPLEVTHAVTMYTDAYVYRGDFFGMTNCYGTFSTYRLPVPTESIQADVSVPEKAVAGETVTVTVEVQNTWRPLQTKLTSELCVDGSFCTEKNRSDIDIGRGQRTVEIPYTVDRAGELSVDVSGPIGLDMSRYPVSGLSADCDRDGQNEPAAQCEMIAVGEVTGSGVTAVKSTSSALFDTDLMAQAMQLKWAQVTAWLTTLF